MAVDKPLWQRVVPSIRQMLTILQKPQCEIDSDHVVRLQSRVQVLEERVRKLHTANTRLSALHTLLALGDTFRQFHRALLARTRTRDVEAAACALGSTLASHGITPEDILRTTTLCRIRNFAAHPSGENPDLTDVDPELVRVHDAVKRAMSDLLPSESHADL